MGGGFGGSSMGYGGGAPKRGNTNGLGLNLRKPNWDIELARMPKFNKYFLKDHPITLGRPQVRFL